MFELWRRCVIRWRAIRWQNVAVNWVTVCCGMFSSLISCIPLCTVADRSDNVSLSQVFYFKRVKVLQLSSATYFGHYVPFPRFCIGMFMLSLILKYMLFVAWLQLNTFQLCVLLFSWVLQCVILFKLYKQKAINTIQNVNTAVPFTGGNCSYVTIGPSRVLPNTEAVFILSR